MPYNTGNAMPSKDPRDLYDNATNFDKFSTGSEATYPDRLGIPRRSLAGYGMAFDESQLARDASFQAFLLAAGYVWLGDYTAGITFTARNQYIVRSGSTYRVAPTTSIPHTLTGTWATDQPKLVLLETAGTILTQLGASTGATLVGTPEGTVQVALDARLKGNITLSAVQNLNSLSSSAAIGVYRQTVPANATLDLNYPVEGVGGTLEVYIGSGNRPMQEFTTSDLRKFIRWFTQNTPTVVWTGWRLIGVPLGGIVGQSLINTGDGVGAWGTPQSVDATPPGIKIGLIVDYVSANQSNPITVVANMLSFTDVNLKSVLVTNFAGSAQQGVATTGLNALDSGVWGTGEYHLYAIYNPTTLVSGLLWSRSATAPTMPTGFTHKVWLSANIRQGASLNFATGIQYGKRFTRIGFSTFYNLTSGVVGALTATTSTLVAASTAAIVPTLAVAVRVTLMTAQSNTGPGSIVVGQTINDGSPAGIIGPPYASTLCRLANADPYAMAEWIPLRTRDLFVAATGAGCATNITGWEFNQ